MCPPMIDEQTPTEGRLGDGGLADALNRGVSGVATAGERFRYGLGHSEQGRVTSVAGGVVRASGLATVGAEEVVEFESGGLGLALELDRDGVGIVVLEHGVEIGAGQVVRGTGRVMDVPVGEALLGRVVDPLGRPLDERGRVRTVGRRPVERRGPAIMERAPIDTPLQTGIMAIDALVPIGRGQRELIVGDRQTGKSTIAVDTIVNQRDTGVICVYCAIGQQTAGVAKVIAGLRGTGAIDHSVVVVVTGEDPVGLRHIAPYAATTMAEHFVEAGRDVLIVYDDLTRHARAYRELSLLLRRPPGREAYPGDIFYLHSRLLERSARRSEELGGGSLTALPIVETQAENLAAYIPTNLVSITDGQVYLSPRLFRSGQLPPVDIGRSVSRVGAQAQLPAYRALSGNLRLSYAQFEELERFTRYGARLEHERRRELERGRRVREVLKQTPSDPRTAVEQIAVLIGVTSGAFDGLEPGEIAPLERRLREHLGRLETVAEHITAGRALDDHDRRSITDLLRELT